MLSGGTSGLVSIDVLRKEKEENKRRDRNNLPLEGSLTSSFIIIMEQLSGYSRFGSSSLSMLNPNI